MTRISFFRLVIGALLAVPLSAFGGRLELRSRAGRTPRLRRAGKRMAGADAGVRARSGGRARRFDLHRGHARQQDRALRPQDPHLQGMGSALRARGRTDCSWTGRASSGTRATATAPSAASIRRPARSPSSRRPPAAADRTRSSSPTTAPRSGSRCKAATRSDASIRRRGRSRNTRPRAVPTASRSIGRATSGSAAWADDRLGRIDAKTGAVTEVAVPGRQPAAAHGHRAGRQHLGHATTAPTSSGSSIPRQAGS